MQLTDNDHSYVDHYQILPGRPSERTSGAPVDACGRLVMLLSSGLLIVAGPSLLGAVTQASLIAVQIVFEVCHAALVAYQLFGR